MLPSISGHINGGDDEEEEFGDFVFSSPYSSSHAPFPFPYPAPALRHAAAAADGTDEGWTDFLASSLESTSIRPHSFSPPSPPFDPFSEVSLGHPLPLEAPYQLSLKEWEKSKGAIPLSIFGEKDSEEPEPLEHPGDFYNGFVSLSLSSNSSRRPAPTGKLNNILEILYDQAGSGLEQDDDVDDGSWDFKDASSAYSTPEIDVNRIENGWKDMDRFMNSHDSVPGDLFASHEELTVVDDHSVTKKFLHEIPSSGNGALSIDTNGYRLEFPDKAIKNVSTKKIQVDQADVIYPSERNKGKEVKWNMWEIDEVNISTYANGKRSHGNSEDHIEPNTGVEKTSDSPTALTSIIRNMYENADGLHATHPSQNPVNNVQEIDQQGQYSGHISDDIEFDQFDWEFQNAVETAEAEKDVSYESGKILSSNSSSYNIGEIYCKLKEGSLSLIVHHLAILKVPAIPGATPEVKNINEEIQEAYGNLQEMMASQVPFSGKEIIEHTDQLLNVTRALNFEALEHENSFSERLLAAETDLNAAIELFVHYSSALHVLRLASKEQQLLYINAWSKLASACTQELQLGAKIWTKSLDRNISKQLLVKGNKYFNALGEVFRVSKILNATAKFYMPWLLSNLEDSIEIVVCLKKCNEAWISSGLEDALQTISNDTDVANRDLTQSLLESIKLIDKITEPLNQDPHNKHELCKFCLLPLGKLPEMTTVVWNEDCYFTKLANLWANRISPNPPQLPSVPPI